eukprot:TRINITY_DN523_c0_g1_i1.p2 TRINITY_DN523_c0_g1~~TRINITY_DN523_c0_g1_i1.p2  ORF type:complete len:130 (+),score=13.29 TRINITY_DN523_c0_g1_i1:669-1058(+)
MFRPFEPAKDKFDIIFWNIPWNHVDEPAVSLSPLEMAVFDPGLNLLERYFREGFDFLSPDGELFVGYSSTHAEWDAAVELCSSLHIQLVEVAAMECGHVRIELLRASRIGAPAACAVHAGREGEREDPR